MFLLWGKRGGNEKETDRKRQRGVGRGERRVRRRGKDCLAFFLFLSTKLSVSALITCPQRLTEPQFLVHILEWTDKTAPFSLTLLVLWQSKKKRQPQTRSQSYCTMHMAKLHNHSSNSTEHAQKQKQVTKSPKHKEGMKILKSIVREIQIIPSRRSWTFEHCKLAHPLWAIKKCDHSPHLMIRWMAWQKSMRYVGKCMFWLFWWHPPTPLVNCTV